MKRHIVKSFLAAALTAALVLSLGAAGGQDDPLVPLSWLVGGYRAALTAELDAAVEKSFDSAYLRLTSQTGSGRPLTPPAGYTLRAMSDTTEIFPGQTLSLAPGAIFMLTSGETSAVISAGDTLDLTEGTAVSGAFAPVRGRRYMASEGGALSFGSVGVASVVIDGYCRLDGEALAHHPVFADVGAREWFYPAVDYVYVNKLYNGTSPTEFSPGTPMTRAMFVTVLGRLEGVDISLYSEQTPPGEESPEPSPSASGTAEEETSEPPAAEPAIRAFPDVLPDAYYAPYVAWASSTGVVLGYEDGTFKPDLVVTREQMAAVMYRYAYWLGEELSVPDGAGELFPDFGDVADYASAPMKWAVSQSVLSGANGKLLPRNTATRAEVAQIIKNFAGRVPPQTQELTPPDTDTAA
ncbi:MAG: S-layer homology domain-containing protein [Oscillospiraceae bacterium]|jgi:hypothetical protein|nr:S-layer homology domain-containing protein [Oscillospiraceae bacterium]